VSRVEALLHAWADRRDRVLTPTTWSVPLRWVVNGTKVAIIGTLTLAPGREYLPLGPAVAWCALAVYCTCWLAVDVLGGVPLLDKRISPRGALAVFGLTLVPLTSPLWLALTAAQSSAGTPLHVVCAGGIVWARGCTTWLVSEWQLRAWRRCHPRGSRYLDTGLWRTSRHPNYRGELLMLAGYAILSNHAAVWLCMAWIALTVHLPNVVRLDRHMCVSRGPEYLKYAKSSWLL